MKKLNAVPMALAIFWFSSFPIHADERKSPVDLSSCKDRESYQSDLQNQTERGGWLTPGKLPEACRAAMKDAEKSCYDGLKEAEESNDDLSRETNQQAVKDREEQKMSGGDLKAPIEKSKAAFEKGRERFKKSAVACHEKRQKAKEACEGEESRITSEMSQQWEEQNNLIKSLNAKKREHQEAARMQAPNVQALADEIQQMSDRAESLRQKLNSDGLDLNAVRAVKKSAEASLGRVVDCQIREAEAFDYIVKKHEEQLALIPSADGPAMQMTGAAPPTQEPESGSAQASGSYSDMVYKELGKHAISGSIKQGGQIAVTKAAEHVGTVAADTLGRSAGRALGPVGILLSDSSPTSVCDVVFYNPVTSISRGCGTAISMPLVTQAAQILSQK